MANIMPKNRVFGLMEPVAKGASQVL